MNDHSQRKRPVLFTVWLWINVLMLTAAALIYFLAPQAIVDTRPPMNKNVSYAYGLISVASVYCTYLLLRWRRAGFWGSLAISIGVTVANFYYTDYASTVVGVALGLITIAFLFWGGSNRLWTHFK